MMPAKRPRSGPLAGLRVVELGGIGPAPFCAMLLADLGAEVIASTETRRRSTPSQHPVLHRGRRSVTLDLKSDRALAAALALIDTADAVIEGYPPRRRRTAGLRSATCLSRNPRLVFGRMTGWGETGPLAQEPGHRHQLHRRRRCPRSHGPSGRAAASAVEPHRRYGRGWNAARPRYHRRTPARTGFGARAGSSTPR